MRNDRQGSGNDAGGAIATIAVGAMSLKVFGVLAKWALIGGAITGVVWLLRRIAGSATDDETFDVQYAPSAAGLSLAP